MNTNVRNWLLGVIAILLLTVGGLGYLYNQKRIESADREDIITGLNDTLVVWKDKQGRSHSKTQTITVSDPKDLLKIKGLEGENKKLQDLVAEYKGKIKKGGSVTYIEGETKYVDRVVTEIDTIYTNQVKYPTYRSSFDKDGWVKGNIIAKADSTQIDLKIKNAYGVVLGQENTGFLGLGKPKTFADVLSYNPYSESTAVRALQVQLPKQNKGKYIIGGIVIGAIGGILLVK